MAYCLLIFFFPPRKDITPAFNSMETYLWIKCVLLPVKKKKKIEKVSKKAHSPSGMRMKVGLASVVPIKDPIKIQKNIS